MKNKIIIFFSNLWWAIYAEKRFHTRDERTIKALRKKMAKIAGYSYEDCFKEVEYKGDMHTVWNIDLTWPEDLEDKWRVWAKKYVAKRYPYKERYINNMVGMFSLNNSFTYTKKDENTKSN